MAAKKVIDSVEAEPPFTGLTRVVAGGRYPYGAYLAAPGGSMQPGAGWGNEMLDGFHFVSCSRPLEITSVEGRVWFVPLESVRGYSKIIQPGDTIKAGTLSALSGIQSHGMARLLLVDDNNEVRFVELTTGHSPFVLDRTFTVLYLEALFVRVGWQA